MSKLPRLQCIVPLAGPDFVLPDGSLKPLYPIDGKPLIARALESRSWYRTSIVDSEDLVFVLRETEHTGLFERFLRERYPRAKRVTISDLTSGALLSAAAGAGLLKHPEWPVCVDLVDIIYDCRFDPIEELTADTCSGVLPYFEANDSKYSYLVIKDGHVTRTAEKKVISTHASAGTYFFRDLPTFFHAVSESLRHIAEWSVGGVLFLCPAYNALVGDGKIVKAIETENVVPVSALFHR